MNETCMGLILVNISVHRLCEEMTKRKEYRGLTAIAAFASLIGRNHHGYHK